MLMAFDFDIEYVKNEKQYQSSWKRFVVTEVHYFSKWERGGETWYFLWLKTDIFSINNLADDANRITILNKKVIRGVIAHGKKGILKRLNTH